MHEYATTLITLGGLFMLGMATDVLGRHTPLPRVTLLLLLGFLIGPSALGVLPEMGAEIVDLVSVMALVMIGFLVGGTLTRGALRRHGRRVLIVSSMMVLATVAVVALGLLALGVPLAVALLLAGIAPATDPAATADVAHELGAKGPFTETLMGIVAVDDAWGLLAFTVVLAAVSTLDGVVVNGPAGSMAGPAGLIAHGANLLLLGSGGEPGSPPVLDEAATGPFSDPLEQALVLTAIVITFGVTAFLLTLAYRSWTETGLDEVEDDVEDRRIAGKEAT